MKGTNIIPNPGTMQIASSQSSNIFHFHLSVNREDTDGVIAYIRIIDRKIGTTINISGFGECFHFFVDMSEEEANFLALKFPVKIVNVTNFIKVTGI